MEGKMERDYFDANAEQRAKQLAQDKLQAETYMAGRMKTAEERLSDIFTFHDDPSKAPNYGAVRSAAKHLAEVIISNSPNGQDQSLAILYVRQAVMLANAAIDLNGRSF
jgi:hypothetical protein